MKLQISEKQKYHTLNEEKISLDSQVSDLHAQIGKDSPTKTIKSKLSKPDLNDLATVLI